MLLSLAPAPEIIGVIRSYAIPEESMSLMKAPLDVVHRIAVGGLEMEAEDGPVAVDLPDIRNLSFFIFHCKQ